MGLIDSILNTVLKYNMDMTIAFLGSKGSGKSYACLRCAELLDPDFDPSTNVVFSTEDFIQLVSNRGDKKLKRGAVVIFEEIGVNVEARRFFTDDNINLSHILETFRTNNLIVLMNTPDQSFTDAKLRKLFDFVVEMNGILHKREVSYGSIKIVQNNPVLGRTYYKHKRGIKDGEFTKVKSIVFSIPTKKTRDFYEKARTKFKEGVMDKAISQIEDSKKFTALRQKQIATPTIIAEKYIKKYKTLENFKDIFPKRNITAQYIAAIEDIHSNKAAQVLFLIKKSLKT